MKRTAQLERAGPDAFARSAWRAIRRASLSLVLALSVQGGASSALDAVNFRVDGASQDLVSALRASSLILAAQEADRTAAIDLLSAARAEYGRLIGLLYEAGYYSPAIQIRIDGREAAEIAPLSQPQHVDRIDIDIDLGPQFLFGALNLSPLADGTVLPAGFATGAPAASTAVRDAVAAALDAWRAQGHPQARVADQDVVANHGARRLSVTLRIDPGPQLRVGRIVPEGNDRTRDERIVDIAGLEPGTLHTPDALSDAQERLRATGAFNSVVLRTAERANPDGTIDVEARVDEALPRRLGFGAELDSEAGGRLSGFWLHRNLFGGAERLRLEAAIDGIGARVGGLGFTLDARYVRPATGHRDTDLEIGLRAVRLNERDYTADALNADVRLVRRFSSTLTGSLGLALRFERARFGGGSSDFGTFGIPLIFTQDTRDVALDATRGRFLMAELMPYAGFRAARSGLRLRFDARAYHDLGTDGRFVLAGRAQLGAVVGPSLSQTPRDFLFYSGGGGTVRGLPYQSLGVAGPPASGGQGFAALSAELRMRVNETLTLAAFADAGAVGSGAFSGTNDWQAGGGLGLRYGTPIGPLRLDLATPIRRNATATGGNFQIYLGIGQAF
ncbi:MAG: BamA/TamA family outer membrane protein [Paracoccaceae bacterium]